jgi:hypothetical protein
VHIQCIYSAYPVNVVNIQGIFGQHSGNIPLEKERFVDVRRQRAGDSRPHGRQPGSQLVLQFAEVLEG